MGKELDPAKGGGGAMDVDGGDAKKGTGAADATVPATPPGPPSVPAVLTAAASLMDRAAKTKDVRGLPNRALRLAAGARSRFDGPGLTAFLDATFPAGDEARGVLAGAVAQVRKTGLRGGADPPPIEGRVCAEERVGPARCAGRGVRASPNGGGGRRSDSAMGVCSSPWRPAAWRAFHAPPGARPAGCG